MSCKCWYTVYYPDNNESVWEFNTRLSYKILKILADIYLKRIESDEGELPQEILGIIQSKPDPSNLLEWIFDFISSEQKEINIEHQESYEDYSVYFFITDLDSGENENFQLR